MMVVAVIMIVVMVVVMMVVMIMFVVMIMVMVVVLTQFTFHFLELGFMAGTATAMVTHGNSPRLNR